MPTHTDIVYIYIHYKMYRVQRAILLAAEKIPIGA